MKNRTRFPFLWNRGFRLMGLLALLCAAPVLVAQNTDHKIDRSLMTSLSSGAEATAPFFVVLKERAELTAASRIPDWAARGAAVVAALQATANRSQAGVRAYLQGEGVTFTPYWVMNAIYVPAGNLALARALARRPEVAAVIAEEVFTLPPLTAGGAATQAVEWNIAKIRADQVWGTTQGQGVVVANIDSGVRYTHQALVGQYRGNLGGSFSHADNWYDPTLQCGAVPCDNTGHGTHTMGTMAGTNGIGVAPGAKWIACKGCITSTCWSSHLVACAEWIMAPGGSAAKRPHVVNNSWGGGPGNPWYQSYVDSWRAAGIFPAFSAGNSGPACGTAGSPGDYPQSFASGATDSADVIASFSSRGPSAIDGGIKPDVSAPGVSVRSSYNSSDSSYAWGSGTSMASPHTAGTVALVWAAQPALVGNIAATEQLLGDTAVKLQTTEDCGGTAGQIPNNTYGYGRIDALAAVGGSPPPPENQPPAVTITSPANGEAFACGTEVTFTGTASDPEDGSLTASIAWTDNGAPLGTGGTVSKTYDCSGDLGGHTIVARVEDSGGLSDTDSITITIFDASVPAAPTLSATVDGATVHLSWTDTAETYDLERREAGKGRNPAGPWGVIATTPATTYDDTPGNGDWEYRVKGCNGTTCSDYSNLVQVKVGKGGGPRK